MAQLVEDALVIKVSKLFRDNEGTEDLWDGEFISQLEAIIAELLSDPKVMVEVIKTQE